MKRRTRIATAAGALGAACLVLLPLATGAGAGAAAAPLESYQMVGVARGLELTFAFKNFVLERVVDLGVPHASTELKSEAGGTGRSEASQVFPGDVVAGAINPSFPGGLPGYRVMYYPPGGTVESNSTNSLFGQALPVPSVAGPMSVGVGHLVTTVRRDVSLASATTQRILLAGVGGPAIDITNIASFSESKVDAKIATNTVRTVIQGITLTPSPAFSIRIGSLVSEATTSSDGIVGTADGSIKASDVKVISGASTYGATLDSNGLHILAPTPPDIPTSLDQSLSTELDLLTKQLSDSGVVLKLAPVVKTVEGADTEASIGGLVITTTGQIPRLPPNPAAVDAILGPIYKKLPTICPARDISDQIPLPVCVSAQLIPGPGTASVVGISIGNVQSLSAAAATEIISAPPVNPPPVNPGDFTGGFTGGGGTNIGPLCCSPGPTQPQTNGSTRLFGRVARMPSGALAGTGIGFLVVAVVVAMGPSLRRWRTA